MKESPEKDYFYYMILVTGGTGLVGSHLLYRLLKRGEDVRAIYRNKDRFAQVEEIFSIYTDNPGEIFKKIEWVKADVNDIPGLTEAMNGVTQVYHSAAYISFDPSHFNKLQKINIEGTSNLVNLSLEAGIQKFCFVSSIASLGETVDGSLITEDIHWNSEEDNSVYAISKYGAEMEVWRGTQEGLKAVIVNPAVILGTGARGSGSGSIVRMAAKGAKYYTPGGIAVVDVRDVVDAMLQLMDSDIENERFILAGSNLHQKEFLDRSAKVFNVNPPRKEISKRTLGFVRFLDWLSSKITGSRRRLFKATIRSLFTVNFYDGGKITSMLPSFRYTSLEDTLGWASENFKK